MDDVDAPIVSVVMPCLNEEEALPSCIAKIQGAFEKSGLTGEIIVADNGSTDRSVEVAQSLGARVVHQPLRGYGNAYFKGFEEAQGRFLIMGDADDTYDFSLIPEFVERLQSGDEFVTGSRYLGKGDKNITFLHRWLGNPMLTFLLNVLFGARYSDVYCGFRAFPRQAYDRIKPVSPGMEFNLELAINAHLSGLRISEIPIVLGERKGVSKLHTLKDGWRSLRMMLLYAPNKVFIVPGVALFATGMLLHLILLLHLIVYQGRVLGAVSGIAATVTAVSGFEILNLGLHAKTYSWSRRFDQNNKLLAGFYRQFNFEMGLLTGLFLLLCGVTIAVVLIREWMLSGLMPLARPEWAPFAATLIIIGLNIAFSSVFISAMSLSKRSSPAV